VPQTFIPPRRLFQIPDNSLSSNAGLARMGRAFGWSYDDLVMHIVDEALMRSQSHTAAEALVSGVSAA